MAGTTLTTNFYFQASSGCSNHSDQGKVIEQALNSDILNLLYTLPDDKVLNPSSIYSYLISAQALPHILLYLAQKQDSVIRYLDRHHRPSVGLSFATALRSLSCPDDLPSPAVTPLPNDRFEQPHAPERPPLVEQLIEQVDSTSKAGLR
jgi:hypothetical protein